MNEHTFRYHAIFNPDYLEEGTKIATEGTRFVYYTSADTALKILRNNELWFRNTNVMNDFSEISYGINLVHKIFYGPEGEKFRESVEDIFPGSMKKAADLLAGWEHDWRTETYIACVSVHNTEEDNHGRLSMWRAYGNTALVLNNTPMMAETDLLAVYSVPVAYLSPPLFSAFLERVTNNILIDRKYLQSLGQDTLVSYINNYLFRLAIATKHPGFKEEREWRLYYRPTERRSPGMSEEVAVLGGVPQKVYKLRLENEPHNGLHSADIPTLLNRVIIGPTAYPYVVYKAFVQALED